MRRFAQLVAVAVLVAAGATSVYAADSNDAAEASTQDRIFGVLPNYTTVNSTDVPTQTTRDSFKAASLNTFDPVMYPFIGIMTALGQGSTGRPYGDRYATNFADQAIGNFMTSAVMPSMTHEDSRYYRKGDGGFFSRFEYAASRVAVTRTRSGSTTFNISEFTGTFAAAGLSNLYYSPADRSAGGTLTRWGMQMMWDGLSNELKEFWPDIRTRLHHQ